MIRLVVTVAIILTVCLTPGTVGLILQVIEPADSWSGRTKLLFNVACLSELINATINIFISYKMDSKFRKTFLAVLGTASQS